MRTTIEPLSQSPPRGVSPDAANGMMRFLRRHPVFAYYVLTFGISWGGIVLVLGPGGMFSTGDTMPIAGGVTLVAGPAVAGVLLTALLQGRDGLRLLGTRLRRWRVGARWYAVALLTGPLVMGATAVGLSLASGAYPGFDSAGDMVSTVLAGTALGLMIGVFEELGWTGYALPQLRRRHGVLTTGVVMGLLWGVWHFPMFAGTSDPSGALPTALVVAVFLFAWLPPYRVLMTWVNDRAESLPIAMLMHAPISATAFILGAAASGGSSGLEILLPSLCWGAGFWVLVAVVAWVNRGHLTRRPPVLGGRLTEAGALRPGRVPPA